MIGSKMKVSKPVLPIIPEHPLTIDPESQHGRIQGNWHNSEAPHSVLAARIEHALSIANVTPIRPPSVQHNQHQHRPIVKTWKNICHKAAMTCAILILPSFACLAFGVVGLAAPAALLVASIVLALLGGKPTEEMEATRAARAAQAAEYDPR